MMEPRDYLVFYREFSKTEPIILKSFDDLLIMQIPEGEIKDKLSAVIKDKEYAVVTAQFIIGDINILDIKEMSIQQLNSVMNNKKWKDE